jgi:hypothetical protein
MANVEGPVRVWRSIVEDEGVVGRSVGRLPRIEVIGTLLNVFCLEFRVWTSSSALCNVRLVADQDARTVRKEQTTYGNLDEGSFNVDFHDFDMAACD